MATEPSHRRFTVRDYHQMAEVGILSEDDRVELIDGEIVEMTPVGGGEELASLAVPGLVLNVDEVLS